MKTLTLIAQAGHVLLANGSKFVVETRHAASKNVTIALNLEDCPCTKLHGILSRIFGPPASFRVLRSAGLLWRKDRKARPADL